VNIVVKDKEKRKTTFDRIGKRWRESIDKVKDYEIIESEEHQMVGFTQEGEELRRLLV